MTRTRLVALLTFLAAGAVAAAAQLKTPPEWKWRLDATGSVVEGAELKEGEVRFVAMAPGWHVTTGPGALLYHPGYEARGTFSVEAEIFLFPGESQEEYGVFIGGRNLEAGGSPSYLAFVAKRDGKGAVIRGGASPIVDWKTNDAILPHPGKDTVKNVLRVDVNQNEVVFSANGKDVAKLPRAALTVEGHFGFRFGRNMNVHASRLDVTHRLAPVPKT